MSILKTLFLLISLWAFTACEISPQPGAPQGRLGRSDGQSEQSVTGGVDGGGGNAVVCREEHGDIRSAELLDLFEGASMYALNIQRSPQPVAEQVQKALQVIPASSRNLIAAYASIVQTKMTLLPRNSRLDKINDSYEIVLPADCQVEQLARFYSEDRILVNGEIWAALNETDRAALILHEATYAANRLVGAQDSRRSRHIVAQLFDPSTRWEDVKDSVPADALTCIATNGVLFFKAFKNTSNNWILNFEILGQAQVVSKKMAIIPGQTGIDLNEAASFPAIPGEDKIGTSVKIATSLISNFESNDIITLEKMWEAPRSQTGQVISGYQMPRYYLSWQSGSFPNMKTEKLALNCSVKINTPK